MIVMFLGRRWPPFATCISGMSISLIQVACGIHASHEVEGISQRQLSSEAPHCSELCPAAGHGLQQAMVYSPVLVNFVAA